MNWRKTLWVFWWEFSAYRRFRGVREALRIAVARTRYSRTHGWGGPY